MNSSCRCELRYGDLALCLLDQADLVTPVYSIIVYDTCRFRAGIKHA